MYWHNMNSNEVLKKLDVDYKKGLSLMSVKKREVKYGKNKLLDCKTKSLFKKLLEQLSDFTVITLLFAAAVSFITSIIHGESDYIDSIIILSIVVVNSIIGIMQESKAEKAINSLKKLSSPYARVLRGGKYQKVVSENIVPGDIVFLNTGDLVCADARIIECSNLQVEESSLTGESTAVEKDENYICKSKAHVADQKNMLFSSSSIISGHAVAVVVETGMNTQVGKIASLINCEETAQTPLQEKLSNTSKVLGIGTIVICLVIFALSFLQSTDTLEMFMISVSLAVAAIPEGLPAVVTIVLASGVRRMASRNAIVRRLPAVETLGSANVICSDKTGTLTQNKMTVVEIRGVKGKENFKSKLGDIVLSYGMLCNNSKVNGKSLSDSSVKGDPTEKALFIAAMENGKSKFELESKLKRVDEIAFDSSRKLMTTIHKSKEGYKIITKGAPDTLFKLCTHYVDEYGNVVAINSDIISKIKKFNNEMASRALRVLAIAYKDLENLPKSEYLENGMIFCGLVGMMDPPRPETKQAVKECIGAGIHPVMITGDHILTAKAIAEELGILHGNLRAITGEEIEMIRQEDLENKIFSYSVFARVSPEHKVRIVKAYQSKGAVVAMTGDGVNDAPALKASDIGCAMGMSGTDVAKSASDMIMTDDNFATIVEAVRQGRGMYDNIKKTVHFLLSTNIGEVLVVLVAFLLRIPSPLAAIQLLWINLVTDSFPALALGMDPVDKDVMKRKPVENNKSLFSGGMWYNIIVEGCFIGAIALLVYTIGRVFFDITPDPVIGRTMGFATLGISQLIHAFNVRTERSIFETGIFGNISLICSFILCVFLQVSVIAIPQFNGIFKTSYLTFFQWILVILFSMSSLVISEIEKLLIKTKSFNKKKGILSKISR